ncbi:MAG TPA: LuxR family transcriptional regulator, partial [Coriobacteriia bacterium]|nr:LuxR family transcriptional regulator [Coriobacteriia bacterium]
MIKSSESTRDNFGKGILHELVLQWPALPYLGLGILFAWVSLTYSGALWLSDVETNGANLSSLFIASTATYAGVCLISPFVLPFIRKILSNPTAVLAMGCIAGLGALFIIASGPYYLLYINEPLSFVLFWSGTILTGAGTAVVGLKYGEMYGGLAPRRVLLYMSLSQLVVVFIYFVVVASPRWAPVVGGPSFVSISAFCLLPVLAAYLAKPTRCLHGATGRAGVIGDDQAPEPHDARRTEYSENMKVVPRVFWRLVALTFLLSFVASMMRGAVVDYHALAITFEGSNILMLLRFPLAVIFIVIALHVNAQKMNFGKLYSLVAIILGVMIACVPIFGQLNSELSILTYFAAMVLEFVMWCLLAFIVFQKKTSPVFIFGFGRGVFMLGSAVGWWFGAQMLPRVAAIANEFAFYIICAGVVLVLSIVLFSERNFERLFSPISENELSLEELLEPELIHEKSDGKSEEKRGRFSKSIEHLAEQGRLSARETEVFRYLAIGHGSSYIAEQLQVSWNTARTHTHNVYVKLNVHSRQQLISLIDEA